MVQDRLVRHVEAIGSAINTAVRKLPEGALTASQYNVAFDSQQLVAALLSLHVNTLAYFNDTNAAVHYNILTAFRIIRGTMNGLADGVVAAGCDRLDAYRSTYVQILMAVCLAVVAAYDEERRIKLGKLYRPYRPEARL